MIPRLIKRSFHKFLKHYNYDLVKFPYGDLAKRMEIIKQYSIETILDVGANIGEFANTMREAGYKHEIISFEPRKSAYDELIKVSSMDPKWKSVNIALGNEDGKSIINVAGNYTSSSLLDMNNLHSEIKPHSKYIGKEEITIKRLDSIINNLVENDSNLYLKIDTQGYEKYVLEGATNSLDRICVIQLEMSLAELYKGGNLIYEMIPYLENKGFYICSIERGFHDMKTGRLLQVDGIFISLKS